MGNRNMSAPVGLETTLGAVAVGIIGAGALMVAGGVGVLWAVTLGAALAVVVWIVLRLLMGNTLEPPRGEGNIDLPDAPPTRTIVPATREMPSPVVNRDYQTKPLGAMSTPAAAAEPAGDTETVEQVKPALLSAARGDGPDDLKKIKGVGPKLEELLHTLGVYHFDQIANWTAGEVAWVDDNLEGFKGRVSRDGWVEQARLLSGGGETEFSKRVEDGEVY